MTRGIMYGAPVCLFFWAVVCIVTAKSCAADAAPVEVAESEVQEALDRVEFLADCEAVLASRGYCRCLWRRTSAANFGSHVWFLLTPVDVDDTERGREAKTSAVTARNMCGAAWIRGKRR